MRCPILVMGDDSQLHCTNFEYQLPPSFDPIGPLPFSVFMIVPGNCASRSIERTIPVVSLSHRTHRTHFLAQRGCNEYELVYAFGDPNVPQKLI